MTESPTRYATLLQFLYHFKVHILPFAKQAPVFYIHFCNLEDPDSIHEPLVRKLLPSAFTG